MIDGGEKEPQEYREGIEIASRLDNFAKCQKTTEEEEPREKDSLKSKFRNEQRTTSQEWVRRGKRSDTLFEMGAGSLHSTLQCVKNSGCSGSYVLGE